MLHLCFALCLPSVVHAHCPSPINTWKDRAMNWTADKTHVFTRLWLADETLKFLAVTEENRSRHRDSGIRERESRQLQTSVHSMILHHNIKLCTRNDKYLTLKVAMNVKFRTRFRFIVTNKSLPLPSSDFTLEVTFRLWRNNETLWMRGILNRSSTWK